MLKKILKYISEFSIFFFGASEPPTPLGEACPPTHTQDLKRILLPFPPTGPNRKPPPAAPWRPRGGPHTIDPLCSCCFRSLLVGYSLASQWIPPPPLCIIDPVSPQAGIILSPGKVQGEGGSTPPHSYFICGTQFSSWIFTLNFKHKSELRADNEKSSTISPKILCWWSYPFKRIPAPHRFPSPPEPLPPPPELLAEYSGLM